MGVGTSRFRLDLGSGFFTPIFTALREIGERDLGADNEDGMV